MTAGLFSCIRTLKKSQTKQPIKLLFFLLSDNSYATIQSQITNIDTESDNSPESLVGACSGSSSFAEADHLFDRIPQRLRVRSDRLIPDGFGSQSVLNVLKNIHSLGFPLDGLTLSLAVKACTSLFKLNFGKQVHCQCVKSGLLSDVSVGTSLIDMYMKEGDLADGKRVFDDMEDRSVVTWTSLIAGFARTWSSGDDVKCFKEMLREGVKPNAFTYACILTGSVGDGSVEKKAIQVHCMVIKSGFGDNIFVGNALVHLYMKVGLVRDAGCVFDSMESKDEITWKGMLAGYVANGNASEAVEMLHKMRIAGISVSHTILATIIKLSTYIKELDLVRQLHCQVVRKWFESGDNFATGLLVAYSKCGKVDCAYRVFRSAPGMRNVVSWTAIISGYLQNGNLEQGISLFHQMIREGVRPNNFTYSVILGAYPFISPYEVHVQVIKTNYQAVPTVGTALLDAYIKIGDIDTAKKVFDLIGKDIVAWSAMLSGYAQVGDTGEAVKTYMQLGKEGVRPNEYTYSSVINACTAPAAAVEQGKQLHACSIKWGYSGALCVSSALVTMYAKRGNIDAACKVFCRQKERDSVSWNSMISGYAQHGHARKALEVFNEMERRKINMDGITFVGVISACTHAGLVEQGEKYYSMMVSDHGITPTMEHYSCMVDLYSRAGMLEKAMEVIIKMPFSSNATVWRSILAGCRVKQNLEIGKLAAEKLISLQPDHSAAYILLSNIYAAAGKWKEKSEVRKLMDERKVKKEAGYSWIEVKKKTYSFLAGDVSHPLSDRIYEKLAELLNRLKDMGYRPDTNYVLHDVEEEYKEAILLQHSEKLALAFGLISMLPEAIIQIEKNLRVCGDCHNVFKLVTKIEQREIIVRDSNRFHHFKDGSCSCGDFW